MTVENSNKFPSFIYGTAWKEDATADLVETAVNNVLAGGIRTADIMSPGKAKVSTKVMGETIIRELEKLTR